MHKRVNSMSPFCNSNDYLAKHLRDRLVQFLSSLSSIRPSPWINELFSALSNSIIHFNMFNQAASLILASDAETENRKENCQKFPMKEKSRGRSDGLRMLVTSSIDGNVPRQPTLTQNLMFCICKDHGLLPPSNNINWQRHLIW